MAKAPKIEKEDYSTATARAFAEAIANGTAPWMKPWAPGELQAAYNPTTGKPYRGFNQTWLSLQAYGDPRWLTYKQAEAVGAQVRKGQSGTTIEYWQWSEERTVKDERTGKPLTDGEGKAIKQNISLESPKRFYARVFNAEQIDGLEQLPPRVLAPEWERHAMAETVIRNSPAAIRHVSGLDSAYYVLARDQITLPERAQFGSPDLYYATAFHEIAHSTGHPTRLDRDMAHPFGSEGYAREELVAEIASFMISQRTGLAFDPGQHHSYVGGWLRALDKDPREIFRAAAAAEKSMEFVLGLEHAQRIDLAQDMTHEHLLAAVLTDPEQQFEAMALTHQLREASQGYLLYGHDFEAADDALGKASAEAVKDASERIAYMKSSLLAFSGRSSEHRQAASIVLSAAIPAAQDQAHIIGGDLADYAQTTEFANVRSDLTTKILSMGLASPVWQAVASSSHEAALTGARGHMMSEFAEAVGAGVTAGYEASHLSNRLANALDAIRFDGHIEYAEAVETLPSMAALRADFAAFAERSEAHAFVAGVALYEQLAVTRLGQEFSPAGFAPLETYNDRAVPVREAMAVDGLGLMWTNPALSDWLPDGATLADFRAEAESLALAQVHVKAALAFGSEIVAGRAYVENSGIETMPATFGLPFTEMKAYAEKSERHLLIASHVFNLALSKDHDADGVIIRPEWALDREATEERMNDIRLTLAEDQIVAYGAEQVADLEADAARETARDQADRDDELGQESEVERPADDHSGAKRLAVPSSDERVTLKVPFKEKNEAKRAGARWDKEGATWYLPKGGDLDKVSQWLPQAQEVQTVLTPAEEFMEACKEYGLIMDALPVMDGKFHRVPVAGDQKSGTGAYIEKSGAYRGYDDAHLGGHPAGFVQNHRTGKKENWKYSKAINKISPEDRARQEREAAERKAARDAEKLAGHMVVADLVEQLRDQAVAVPEGHAYLSRKDVSGDGLKMMDGAVDFPPGSAEPQRFGGKGHLLIPAHDIDGKVWAVQAISPTGKKSFPKGALKAGCHNLMGDIDNKRPILFTEGWATGKDLHEQTTYPVVACFDAGNLAVVAEAYRERYPDRLLVIAGDNDHKKEQEMDEKGQPKPNVGKEKALATAAAIGGYALLPAFGGNQDGSDWNDLRVKINLDTQLAQLREGMQVAIRRHQAAELTRTGEGERIRGEEREHGLDRDKERDRRRDKELDGIADRNATRADDRAPALSIAR